MKPPDRPTLDEIEVTPEMVEAGMKVDWVQSYQGEFLDFEETGCDEMRALVRELLTQSLGAARSRA
jgi:hypothetical protein